jgi:hypothetical protein
LGGKDYLEYNHFDSYPSCLGKKVVKAWGALKKAYSIKEIRAKVSALRFVKQSDVPSKADVEHFQKFADSQVNNGEGWYSLLRNRQGDIAGILEGGVLIDAEGFINDSLFCEWAYIINLDDNKFEVYRGFQTEPHKKGRYANNAPEKRASGKDPYYPCALIASHSLNKIPAKWAKKSWG